jgi:pteridine reductase
MMKKSTSSHPSAALITGAAARIGRSLAEELSSQGYHIALHYHTSRKAAQELAQFIRSRGGTCELFRCNLADPSAVAHLLKDVKRRFPHLNVLINNASVYNPSSLKKLNLAAAEKDYCINFLAPLVLTSEFAKHCRTGNIINIVDAQIVKNKTSSLSYLLMKKCLAELTKLAAVELAPNIRVNAIAPGVILPPKGRGEDYLKSLIARGVPLQKKGAPVDIAQAVRYLLTNDYLTGQILFVDGGLHLLG